MKKKKSFMIFKYAFCKETDLLKLDVLFDELRTNKSLLENSRPDELLQKMDEVLYKFKK